MGCAWQTPENQPSSQHTHTHTDWYYTRFSASWSCLCLYKLDFHNWKVIAICPGRLEGYHMWAGNRQQLKSHTLGPEPLLLSSSLSHTLQVVARHQMRSEEKTKMKYRPSISQKLFNWQDAPSKTNMAWWGGWLMGVLFDNPSELFPPYWGRHEGERVDNTGRF